MFNQSVDAIGTFILIVVPIAIVLFLILVVAAYPWLLLVPLGIWYLFIKYGPDEVAPTEVDVSNRARNPEPDSQDSATEAETT